MADPTLASNNPFRRKPTIPQPPAADAQDLSVPSPSAAEPLAAQPSGDDFRRALTSLPKSSEAPPSTTFQKPKPVKKVRVQSPPPSSPDSTEAEFEARFPASGHVEAQDDASDSSSTTTTESEDEAGGEDPFRSTRPGVELGSSAGSSHTLSASTQRPPLNPFGRTLQDMEHGSGEAASGAAKIPSSAAGKASLDVDSFRRLLMTGQAGGASSAPAGTSSQAHQSLHPPGIAGDAGSMTDASSISKQSIFDAAQNPQETPRTSHEISEAEDDRRGLLYAPSGPSERPTLRKKPPPPSSRHGKLIKTQPKPSSTEPSREGTPRPVLKQPDAPASPTVPGRRTSSSSDLNKPLPLPPQRRSADGERESVFDQEAAGKVPEVDIDPDAPEEEIPSPRPPTPPNASHSTTAPVPTAPVAAKPAPPPRRQAHPKAEPKVPAPPTAQDHPSHTLAADDDYGQPRSSMDSTHSRSSSLKANTNAPPPPPSRRSNHASRPSTSLVSPSVVSFASSVSSPSGLADPDRSQLGYSHTSPELRTQTQAFNPSSPPSTQMESAALEPSSPPPQARHSRPPPPPARNASVRHKEHHRQADHPSTTSGRPPSVISVEAPTPPAHRTGGGLPPPPPRPRQRGSSRGSTDAPHIIRRKSVDSVSSANRVRVTDAEEATGDDGGQHHHMAAVTEEQSPAGTSAAAANLEQESDPAANDILADLDKLRREVDALRGTL